MRQEQRNSGGTKANEDDHAAQYLLDELNLRRRSQSGIFRRKASNGHHSWIPRGSSSLMMRDSEGIAAKYSDGNCEDCAVLTSEIQMRSDRSNSMGKSKKGPKKNGNGNGNPHGSLISLPSPPIDNFKLNPSVTSGEVPSVPTAPMAASTKESEIVTSGTSTMSFTYITRDPNAAIPTEIIILNPTGTIRPGDTSSTVSVSPTASINSQQGSGDFFNSPAAVAGVAIGATLGASLLITIIGWFLMKFIRKRKDKQGPDGSWANEKNLCLEDLSPHNTSGDFEWDPESTFAPPFVKPHTFRHSYSRSSTSSIIQRLIDHARKSTQGGLALSSYLWRHKPLPQPPPENTPEHTSELTMIKSTASSILEELPKAPEKSHATISTRSSDILCPDLPSPLPRAPLQEDRPTTPRKVHGRMSMSKLSWSTPTTKTTSIASLPQGQRLPSLNSNYAGTVFSEDSEAPRFRSTSSWVLHQQSNLRRKLADLDYPPSPTAVPNSPSVKEIIERNSLKEESEDTKRLSLGLDFGFQKETS